MAPECYTQSRAGYSPDKTDVWSMGILLLNLISAKNPWHRASNDDAMYNIYTSLDPDFLFHAFNISPELNLLIRLVLDPNPQNRITIQQLKLKFNTIHLILRPFHVQSQNVRSASLPNKLASPVQSYLSYYSDTESDLEANVNVERYTPLTPQPCNPCTNQLILEGSCENKNTLFQGITGCAIGLNDKVTL